MDRQNRQTWIAATAVILTVVGTTWWTGRRMITREDGDDLRTEIAGLSRSLLNFASDGLPVSAP